MRSKKFSFDDENEFVHKLKELVVSGIPLKSLTIITPFPVHEVDDVLAQPESKLKVFTLGGALTGFATGLALTILTSLHWPLIGGGKPIVSLPAFIIVAFELTILFGALSSFVGFLILSRLPRFEQIISPEEHSKQFVILIDAEGKE